MKRIGDTTVLATPAHGFAANVPLLIAGGGACGLVAALAAHDAGAEVMVLEAGTSCHGSSGMSLGAVCAAGTAQQRQHGIDDDAGSFFADVMAKTGGQADGALARLIAEQSGPSLDWLAERHGVAFELDLGWKPAFAHTRRRMHASPGLSGRDMMTRLEAACGRAATRSSRTLASKPCMRPQTGLPAFVSAAPVVRSRTWAATYYSSPPAASAAMPQ